MFAETNGVNEEKSNCRGSIVVDCGVLSASADDNDDVAVADDVAAVVDDDDFATDCVAVEATAELERPAPSEKGVAALEGEGLAHPGYDAAVLHADDAVVDDDACTEGRLSDFFRAATLAFFRAVSHLLHSALSHFCCSVLLRNFFGLFFFGS